MHRTRKKCFPVVRNAILRGKVHIDGEDVGSRSQLGEIKSAVGGSRGMACLPSPRFVGVSVGYPRREVNSGGGASVREIHASPNVPIESRAQGYFGASMILNRYR